MRKAAIFKVLLAVALILSFSIVPVFAADGETTELNLINEESGYKINVPNFIDVRTVDYYGDQVTAVIMKTPEKNSDGKYPIFEIVTTDSKAHRVESFPGSFTDGQLGNFEGEFTDGKLMYNAKFAISKDLKEIVEDEVFIFDFVVFDENDELVFDVTSLYFVFENDSTVTPDATPDATPAATPDTTPAATPDATPDATPAPTPVPTQAPAQKATAVPTSAKVVVNGEQVAFDAYNINGNNYFKLRDLAMALNGTEKGFQVEWDGTKNAINLTKSAAYTAVGGELAVSGTPSNKEALLSTSSIYVDGVQVQLTAYNIGGNNYFKLRDVAGVIDFGVTWDGELQMIGIDTAAGYVAE